ncbi:CBO0543 family protein [Effusibacillus dendaii]|uniref:Uncharacterized protein n=1 Tax=Effusibacillus dendaii TaxID=2743772 RepID=A0A7I8DC07_9BACL|nr:CBO0543 family protein [Effusibacillus dendaii]BCJ87537.1 hypothetical protein skT53_25220 [Effusibacillus dendaii]
MTTEQQQYLDRLNHIQNDLTNAWMDYWKHFSHVGTWQFWVNVIILVLPLIVLYFLIDRKKAFHIGFFGFNVHVWFNYIDTFGVWYGLWNYPYRAIPFLPISFALDASLVPVVFMLVYQWTLNHNKNYYLYLTGLCLFFAFVLKPVMVALDLFQMHKGMNYFNLFLGYLVIMLLSKWITTAFVHLQKSTK